MWARPALLLLAVEHGGADRRDAGRRGRHRRPHASGWWWPAASPRCSWPAWATWRRSRSAATPCAGRPATAPSGWRTPCGWCSEDPLMGVGIGGQPSASRRLAAEEREARPTANFVSHTTPLTVAAELGRRRAGALRLADRGRLARDRRCWQARPGARPGARRVPARAVRARALLQRVPRGPAHLARAGHGRGPAHLAAPRRRRAPRGRRGARRDGAPAAAALPRGRVRADGRARSRLLAITLPELGSNPWPFRPGSRRPPRPARPARARGGRGVGRGHRPRRLLPRRAGRGPAGGVVAAPARLARVGRHRAGRVRGAGAAGALHAAPGRAARRHRARGSTPTTRPTRSSSAGTCCWTARTPTAHDYRSSGMERFYTRDGIDLRARARARGLARALRLLPRHRGGRRRLAAGALAVRRLPRVRAADDPRRVRGGDGVQGAAVVAARARRC